MSNLNEVLEFIKNSEKSELKSIYNAYSIRKSEINFDVKNSFRVGDKVGINHRKIDSNSIFTITKINNKNIKVKGFGVNDIYTVSPSLLVKK